MSPGIIGVTGYATSGKDSIAGILVQEFDYHRIAFADALKEMALALDPIVMVGVGSEESDLGFQTRYVPYFKRLGEVVDALGMDEAKKIPEVRRLLQRLGTEAGRNVLGDSIWVDTLKKKAGAFSRIVIPDVRFPNEATTVHELGGVIWRVNRPGAGIGLTHASESEIDNIVPDEVINNNGTLKDLKSRVLLTMVPAVNA